MPNSNLKTRRAFYVGADPIDNPFDFIVRW
jgi:hypothetical protein